MKIKELLENVNDVAHLEIKIEFLNSVKNTITYNSIASKLSFQKRIQYIGNTGRYVEIRIPRLKPEEYNNKEFIKDITDEIEKVINEIFFDEKISSNNILEIIPYIVFSSIPSQKVNCDYAHIHLLHGNSSLHRIDKIFSECKHIILIINSSIKSNVLGLLKLKNVITRVDNTLIEVPLWYTILSKYISSKDILGCQDELIDNGLSQYAKL